MLFETCKGFGQFAQGLISSYFAEHTLQAAMKLSNTGLLTPCLLLLPTRLESACCVLVAKKVNLLLIRSSRQIVQLNSTENYKNLTLKKLSISGTEKNRRIPV